MRWGSRNRSQEAVIRSRAMRCKPSVSEEVMWNFLRSNRLGFKFRRQVPIGAYFMDFYCPEASLCVEVDGDQHLEYVNRDASRDQYLVSKRIHTIRIPASAIFDAETAALVPYLEQIVELCRERAGRHETEF